MNEPTGNISGTAVAERYLLDGGTMRRVFIVAKGKVIVESPNVADVSNPVFSDPTRGFPISVKVEPDLRVCL